MNYNPELGIFGNIKKLFTESNKTNNKVFNNKVEADTKHDESVNGLLDVAEVASDESEALAELGGMVADLYEAVAELGELIAERQ